MREHRERLASAKQKARQLVRHQDVVLTERVDQVERLFLSYQIRLSNLFKVIKRMGPSTTATQLRTSMHAPVYLRIVYPS